MEIFKGNVDDLPELFELPYVAAGNTPRDFTEIYVGVLDSAGAPIAGSGVMSFEGSFNGRHWRTISGTVDLSQAGALQTYTAPVAVGAMRFLRAACTVADQEIELHVHQG